MNAGSVLAGCLQERSSYSSGFERSVSFPRDWARLLIETHTQPNTRGLGVRGKTGKDGSTRINQEEKYRFGLALS